MSNEKIIRSKALADNFVVLPNSMFNDDKLSWEAKGLLGYLMSKPKNWGVMVADLVNRSGNGKDRIYRILKELIAAGYVKKEVLRDDKGRMMPKSSGLQCIQYYVSDSPIFAPPPPPVMQPPEPPKEPPKEPSEEVKKHREKIKKLSKEFKNL